MPVAIQPANDGILFCLRCLKIADYCVGVTHDNHCRCLELVIGRARDISPGHDSTQSRGTDRESRERELRYAGFMAYGMVERTSHSRRERSIPRTVMSMAPDDDALWDMRHCLDGFLELSFTSNRDLQLDPDFSDDDTDSMYPNAGTDATPSTNGSETSCSRVSDRSRSSTQLSLTLTGTGDWTLVSVDDGSNVVVLSS